MCHPLDGSCLPSIDGYPTNTHAIPCTFVYISLTSTSRLKSLPCSGQAPEAPMRLSSSIHFTSTSRCFPTVLPNSLTPRSHSAWNPERLRRGRLGVNEYQFLWAAPHTFRLHSAAVRGPRPLPTHAPSPRLLVARYLLPPMMSLTPDIIGSLLPYEQYRTCSRKQPCRPRPPS